jgi:prephenate dehydrogenase
VIDRLAIVGVGLLGGSLAKAVRAHGLAREIVGIGRDAGRMQAAVRDGALDRATTDLA